MSSNNFVCKFVAFDQNAQQENCKLVIQNVNLIICINKLTRTIYNALMNLLLTKNMVHNYSRIQMKHLSIYANQSFINFDNSITSALPNLVIIGFVRDADLAGGS